MGDIFAFSIRSSVGATWPLLASSFGVEWEHTHTQFYHRHRSYKRRLSTISLRHSRCIPPFIIIGISKAHFSAASSFSFRFDRRVSCCTANPPLPCCRCSWHTRGAVIRRRFVVDIISIWDACLVWFAFPVFRWCSLAPNVYAMSNDHSGSFVIGNREIYRILLFTLRKYNGF